MAKMKFTIRTILPLFAAISLLTTYSLSSQVYAAAFGQATILPELQTEFGTAAAIEQSYSGEQYDEPPPMVIDLALVYHATLQTVRGDIKIKLFDDQTPVTVNNFVYLARDGYYDNTTFHRVIEGFMAQGGDPTGSGAGGPGYAFEDEIVAELTFDRAGLLAMANSGPDTNGSQFFITFAPTSWLNGNHTIFGEVVEGIEVLDEITRRDPDDATTPGDEVMTVLIEESDPPVFELLLPVVVAN